MTFAPAPALRPLPCPSSHHPPIALYYILGLNTTPVHGHAALFGAYAMLGIGLMLFCLRVLWIQEEWKDGLLKFSFWALNIGLLTGHSLKKGTRLREVPD